MHDTQATPVVAGLAPAFECRVQYVVAQEPLLAEYLQGRSLELELCRWAAGGWGLPVAASACSSVITTVDQPPNLWRAAPPPSGWPLVHAAQPTWQHEKLCGRGCACWQPVQPVQLLARMHLVPVRCA
jgi:hypothetical protein